MNTQGKKKEVKKVVRQASVEVHTIRGKGKSSAAGFVNSVTKGLWRSFVELSG